MAGVAGSQPTNLIPDVANGQQAANINQLLQVKMPTAPAPQAPPQAPQMPQGQQQQAGPSEDMLNAIDAQHAGVNEDQLAAIDAEHAEPASFVQRVKAGFAANEKEKEAYLQQEFGKANVRKNKDGDFQIKEDGKWHPFNAKYHLPDIVGGLQGKGPEIGDPANLGRQAVVEAGAAPMEVAGGIVAAGEAASGVGAPAAIPTMAVARAAGGATGEALARHTAYNIIGIPKSGDYAQDATAMAEQGGLRAIFGAAIEKIAKYVSGLFGQDATGVVAKNLTADVKDAVDGLGKGLGQQAAQVSQQAAVNRTTADAASAAKIHLDDVLTLSKKAKEAGVSLYPHELAPFDPKAQKLAQAAMASKPLQDAMVLRGEGISKAAQQFKSLFPNAANKPIEKLMSDGLDNGTILGRTIGEARKKLADTTDHIALDNVQKALPELQEMFGFTKGSYGTSGINMAPNAQGLTTPPSKEMVQQLANKFQRPEGDIRYVIGRISKLSDMAENGKLSPKELNSFYDEFTKAIDARVPAPGTRSATYTGLIQLKNAIRDDVTKAIGVELENSGGKMYQSLAPEQRAAYLQNMADYSKYATAKSNLSKLFDKDTVADVDLVKWLKAGGIGNAERIKDFHTIMDMAGPGAWDKVGKEYVAQSLAEHAMPGAEAQTFGNVNWKAFQKQIQEGTKAGEHFKAIVGEDVAKKVADATDVFSAIQRSNKPFESQPNLVYRAMKAIANFKDPEYAANVFKSDYLARQIMADGATQKIIKRLSEPEQQLINQAYTNAMKEVAMKSLKPQSGLPAQMVNQQLQNQQQQQ